MTINKILPNYTDWNQRIFGDKINELVDAVNSLTGGEKEILCKVCNWSNHNLKDGICENCIKKIAVQEPKFYSQSPASLVKEEPKSNSLREGIDKLTDFQIMDSKIEQIISLFKETLLKEVGKLQSIDGGYGYDRREIEQIIKNL